MNTVRSIDSPTLARVERAFAHWRRHREQRKQTPPQLRQQAVSLLEHHRPSHICQALGLHADALKRWARESPGDMVVDVSVVAPDFVALPSEPSQRQSEPVTLTIERPDGLRLNVSGHFSLDELISSLELAGAPR